jgi:glycosyltransferase involved in cell wall biosynthesis
MPLVSVIIPTYNRAPVIERAVDSVLSQSFRDFELLVVDDGSEDNTAEILLKYGHEIRVITQPNQGVSAARNRGIRESTGKLSAFLDSDDEWLPEKLETQVSLYDEIGPRFVCHTEEIWERNGKIVNPKSKHAKQGGRFFERALELCLISPSSVMISRDLLDETGLFDESLPAAEDYDLWLRITAFYDVTFVSTPLVVKHGGAENQLSMTTPGIDQFRIKAILKILDNPNLPEHYRFAAIKELGRKCAIVASGCLKRGWKEEAEAYLELAESRKNI